MTTTKYSQTIKGNKDAAKPSKRLAELLQKQIKARARTRTGITHQYQNARLRNYRSSQSIIKDLLAGQRTAQEGYDRSEKDATGSLGTATASSRLNRAREGANAMTEVANLGGGITDRIKAMAPAIRGLKANLDPAANDYASAITSINNSLGDLNSSTRTNINNALRERNSNDASAFAEWSAGQQQVYADLVDLYGQEGAAYEQVHDALVGKKSTSKSSGTTNVKSTQKDSYKENSKSKAAVKMVEGAYAGSAWAANQLADQQGRIFTDPIQTIAQMNAKTTDPNMRFTEAAMKQNQSNLDELTNAGTLRKLEDAQGSKLRKKVVV